MTTTPDETKAALEEASQHWISVECFADNGEHSHYEILDANTGRYMVRHVEDEDTANAICKAMNTLTAPQEVCAGQPCLSKTGENGNQNTLSIANESQSVTGQGEKADALESIEAIKALPKSDSHYQWHLARLEQAIRSALLQQQPDAQGVDYVPGSWFLAYSVEQMQSFYMSRLPAIREAAKECGYAVGLHGSTRRDFDLMAMQWRDDAASIDELAHAIMFAACGFKQSDFRWSEKPNGRRACSIPICWAQWQGCYDIKSLGHVDLSVIPTRPQQPAQRVNCPVFPDGWKLVPIEPTEGMMDAGMTGNPVGYSALLCAYRAMLSAAPPAGLKEEG